MVHLLRTPFVLFLIATIFSFSASYSSLAQQVVDKLADGFEQGQWRPAVSSVEGTCSIRELDAAPIGASKRALFVEATYAGTAGTYSVAPVRPLVIPGQVKTISLWLKVSDARHGVKINFKDGWGRDAVGGKPLRVPLRTDGAVGQWASTSAEIPSDWVAPLQLSGISLDNSDARTEKIHFQLSLDQIEVKTDITNVDPSTGVLTTWNADPKPANPKTAFKTAPVTPLVSIDLSTPEQGNVFAGIEPRATIVLRNWKTGELAGSLRYRILDESGQEVRSETHDVRFDSLASFDVVPAINRFGLYTLETTLELADRIPRKKTITFAHIPRPRQLTEEQKTASPYGLNHYGNVGMVIKPFRQAGIIWVRDYGFGYQRLLEARGEGAFTGWPFFSKILKQFADEDMKVLAVLQRSITKPKVENGKVVGSVGPGEQWGRVIAGAITAFPQVKYWEMSNEYDLPADNVAAERLVNWENYRKYHARLADLVDVLSGGTGVTVENGHPGIFPDLERSLVQTNEFKKVAVINSHYYTGTQTPEESSVNYNTHSDSFMYQEKGLFFDQLRAATRAGKSDGVNRQHWLTEFGWDTRAGPVVSPFEQAVFLQRGWLLAMAAGCDKAFWFYNFDSQDPKAFFDGCGLFTHDMQPKLSLSAMAGMAWVLPSPRYVGMISAGENTGGYIFEQDEKPVAVLFAIRGSGPVVNLDAEKVYDYFGNQIDEKNITLTMSPTYAVGLSKTSPLYLQSAYSLDTPYFTSTAAGDVITPVIRVHNNRTAPIDCTITPQLPSGWTAKEDVVRVGVLPGETKRVPIPVQTVRGQTSGIQITKFFVGEGLVVCQIPLKISLQLALAMRIPSITDPPGATTLIAQVGNNSIVSRNGKIKLLLPASWKATTADIAVEDLKPGEVRDVPIALTWNADFKDDERAVAQFESAGEQLVERPLIPNRFALHHVSGIKLDGDLSDWPANTHLPMWMLGSTTGDGGARVAIGWAEEGLYAAVQVFDSKVINTEPKNFWTGDALELFIDSSDNKTSRTFGVGDHQFWFVPLPDANKVFAGQWKVEKEIPETLYDLPQVRGSSVRTADGYVMEFFLPRELIKNFDPKVGGGLGINLNLSVSGNQMNREIYWPRSKSAGVQRQPEKWGSLKLVD